MVAREPGPARWLRCPTTRRHALPVIGRQINRPGSELQQPDVGRGPSKTSRPPRRSRVFGARAPASPRQMHRPAGAKCELSGLPPSRRQAARQIGPQIAQGPAKNRRRKIVKESSSSLPPSAAGALSPPPGKHRAGIHPLRAGSCSPLTLPGHRRRHLRDLRRYCHAAAVSVATRQVWPVREIRQASVPHQARSMPGTPALPSSTAASQIEITASSIEKATRGPGSACRLAAVGRRRPAGVANSQFCAPLGAAFDAKLPILRAIRRT